MMQRMSSLCLIIMCIGLVAGPILAQGQPWWGFPQLRQHDIVDYFALAKELDKYPRIWALLQDERKVLEIVTHIKKNSSSPHVSGWRGEIIGALNRRVLIDRDLSLAEDFSGIALPEEARSLLEDAAKRRSESREPLPQSDIQRLNCLLLAVAYPKYIAKCQLWNMPQDVSDIEPRFDESDHTLTLDGKNAAWHDFAYLTFIALNWPAVYHERGKPDAQKELGTYGVDELPHPVVWQTYKLANEVFIKRDNRSILTTEKWDTPPWSTKQLASRCLKEVNQQDAENGRPKAIAPLVDQNGEYVRYETLMNRRQFEYITDRNRQSTPPKSGYSGQPLYERQGVVEVKAAWRKLGSEEDRDRYFHMQTELMENGECKKAFVGLVGLHILRLTNNSGRNWFWATFEHVDNVDHVEQRPDDTPIKPSFNSGIQRPNEATYGYTIRNNSGTGPTPVNPDDLPPKDKRDMVEVWRMHDISPAAKEANNKYRPVLRQRGRGVWANYQLVGVQVFLSSTRENASICPIPEVPDIPGFFTICQLTNTTIETFRQVFPEQRQKESCIGCHANTRVENNSEPIFSFVLKRLHMLSNNN